jgi:Cd2+/Zn2+-exporting ATPase
VISTPASILSAIANGARKGVLFKGGAHLEKAANIKVVAFDKTGTLTVGKPTVTDVTIIPLMADQPHHADTKPLSEDKDHAIAQQENVLLRLAAAVEAKSEHPLAQAIVSTAKHRGIAIPEVTHFQAITGKGVSGHVQFMGGLDIAVGSPRYFAELNPIGMTAAMREVERLQDEGKTSVIVARSRPTPLPRPSPVTEECAEGCALILGVIAIADIVRPDAPAVIQDLKAQGVQRVVMVTGDNVRVAKAIAGQLGVDDFYADLLPEDKVRMVKTLSAHGDVAMVGDGVNDAPALATAAVGMAMGAAGTDVALETADVVLMSDNLKNIPYAIALSRQARKVVVQNLTFSIAVIIILIIGTLGFKLLLPLGVIGHEGSTVLVVLNGLRLLAFRRPKEK